MRIAYHAAGNSRDRPPPRIIAPASGSRRNDQDVINPNKRMHTEHGTQLPANASEARQWIENLQARLIAKDILFRDPPEEPTTCCGRGCNGCVWEGYLHAVAYWCEQVREIISKS